ncbi:MAG: cytochrome c biogenesis protein CcsA [Pseudomonadales bacterium]
MDMVVPGILACLFYIASAGLQLAGIKREIPGKRRLVITLGTLAVLLHGYFSYHEIFTASGINMGLLPMASLIALAIAALILLSSLRRPVENLAILLFPMAAICISLSLSLPDTYTPRAQVGHGIVIHIILSVIAYGLLTIAAFQAVLLSFGDYELRHRKLGIMRHLPPLQTMEGLLFELLWAGLIVLTMSIGTGFLFLKNSTTAIPGLVHHMVITLAAWIVFAILLWGRYKLGWRGAIASRWTLSGFALLALGYFGSKLVLEVVLGRV